MGREDVDHLPPVLVREDSNHSSDGPLGQHCVECFGEYACSVRIMSDVEDEVAATLKSPGESYLGEDSCSLRQRHGGLLTRGTQHRHCNRRIPGVRSANQPALDFDRLPSVAHGEACVVPFHGHSARRIHRAGINYWRRPGGLSCLEDCLPGVARNGADHRRNAGLEDAGLFSRNLLFGVAEEFGVSIAIEVMPAESGRMTFVASSLPPSPVSITAMSTFRVAK